VKLERKKTLGIYIGNGWATGAVVSEHGDGFELCDCFRVSVEETEQGEGQSVGGLLAQVRQQRELAFTEVAVALDCAMFTQHSMHSEFTDARQIARTVKFDAEDSFAIDASELAVGFNIAKVSESGSELNLFAANRKLLADLLLDLQSNGFDPVTIEPDVTALRRFAGSRLGLKAQSNAILAILSGHSCYLIEPAGGDVNAAGRTFLIGSGQDTTQLLNRQIRLTLAQRRGGEPIESVRLADETGQVNCGALRKSLGIEVGMVDLAEASVPAVAASGEGEGNMEADENSALECADRTGVAIAYGAAVGRLTRSEVADFRVDFAPYQGRKVLVETALKTLSIYVTIILLTAGLYFQLRVMTKNRQRGQLRENLKQQYTAVMDAKSLPGDFLRKLDGELGRVKAGSSVRRPGEQSLAELLTFTLEAINSAPGRIDLKIDSISVSPRNIIITGSTRSQQHTQFFKAVDNHPRLRRDSHTYSQKKNRANFHLTIVPQT